MFQPQPQPRYPVLDIHTYTRMIALTFCTEFLGEVEERGLHKQVTFQKPQQDTCFVDVPAAYLRAIIDAFPIPRYSVTVMYHKPENHIKVRIRQYLPVVP